MKKPEPRSQPPALDRSSLIAYLEAHHMFGVLPTAELASLADEVVERRYAKGHYLCYAGDDASAVFLIKSGLVALTEADERGNAYAVHTYGTGDVFGTMVTLLGVTYTGAAIAMRDTIAILVRKNTFDRLFRLFPELALEIIREQYQIVRRAEETIGRLTVSRVASRVAAFLLTATAQATASGADPLGLELGLSHQDMALLLGTTRRTVTRVFTHFCRSRMISAKGRQVLILQPDALRRIAES